MRQMRDVKPSKTGNKSQARFCLTCFYISFRFLSDFQSSLFHQFEAESSTSCTHRCVTGTLWHLATYCDILRNTLWLQTRDTRASMENHGKSPCISPCLIGKPWKIRSLRPPRPYHRELATCAAALSLKARRRRKGPARAELMSELMS